MEIIIVISLSVFFLILVYKWKNKKEFESRNILKNLTWQCSVCNEIRPDEKIDVFRVFKRSKTTGVDIKFTYKYCNDKVNCIDKVQKKKPL